MLEASTLHPPVNSVVSNLCADDNWRASKNDHVTAIALKAFDCGARYEVIDEGSE